MQSPEIFGLHANADISYYTNATKQIWSNLVDLQPRAGGAGGGMSREEFIGSVAKDIQSKIPQSFDLQARGWQALHRQLFLPCLLFSFDCLIPAVSVASCGALPPAPNYYRNAASTNVCSC